MIHKQKEGIQWLEFELLQEFPLVHGCLMRHGGLSTGLLDSLNLGRHVGDHPDIVHANYSKVVQVFSLPAIVAARVSHESKVTAINTYQNEEIPISDALTTLLPDLAIAVTQADCQAAIFYDPVNHAMANVHCGWRSSIQNIYAETIKSMKATYGSNPANLLVCVSPSLGPQHAEFIHFKTELPEIFWQFKLNDYFFDFWAISQWQLEEAGILSDHMQLACIDTYSHLDYFSHRRSIHLGHGKGGRQATLCMLRSLN